MDKQVQDPLSNIVVLFYLCYMSILVLLHSSALIWIFFGRYRKYEIDMNTRNLLLVYEAIYLVNLTYAIISVVKSLNLDKFDSI